MNEFDIVLNVTEQSIVRFIAEERNRNKQEEGIKDRKYDSADNPVDLNLEGFGAEFAFCKWENVFPDFAIHNFSGGWDALDKWNRRVDVKWSKTNFLLAPEHKKLGSCDIYVLIKGNFPKYRIVGWCEEAELLSEKNLKDWFNKGKVGYGIPMEQLKNMWSNI